MASRVDLIQEYINGGELEGYDVDELENDPEFMREAIMASGDKKLYNLCSDNVKKNYKFVMFLISRFKDDSLFIDKVVTYFLKSKSTSKEKTDVFSDEDEVALDDVHEYISVVVRMCNIFKDTRELDYYATYRMMFIAQYTYDMMVIDAAMSKLTEKEKDQAGDGFIFIKDAYDWDEEVLNYYTAEFIYTIFKNKHDLVHELHVDFKTKEELQEVGIVNYMIRLLRRFDPELANYAAIHPVVLEGLEQSIKYICSRWNYTVDQEEEYDYGIMLDRVHEYYESVEDKGMLSEETYIFYIANELGIVDKLAKLENMTEEEYRRMYDVDDDRFVREMLSRLEDRRIYEEIKRIMKESLFGKTDSQKPEDDQEGGKLVRIDFGHQRE